MEQLELFELPPVVVEEFTNNDYETPEHIAKAIAGLILPSDHYILEPCAGTGQIAKEIDSDKNIDCVEIKLSRFLQGYDW
jgi:hypothetical protein